VSDLFGLGLGQASLDFVDVDVDRDNQLYIDPSAVRRLDTRWGHECAALIEDFFDTLQRTMRQGDRPRALQLLMELQEPNETHLGESSGPPAGHGLGRGKLATDFHDSLLNGNLLNLFEEFEEIALLTDGIDRDILSDITTNIIRQPLIRYTLSMCKYYLIRPLHNVAQGPMWDPATHDWFDDYARLPMSPVGPLLLVPKIIVRRRLNLQYDEYFNHYILPFRQQDEIRRRTELVQVRKASRAPFVTKKSLIAKYGRSKSVAADITRQHTEVLEQYREAKTADPNKPLDHSDIGPEPDWDRLLNDVTSLEPGRDDARRYEDAIQRLLIALFYPWLTNPHRERRQDHGRRRVDITFDNDSTSGFFRWVHESYGAPTVTVECKNYSEDPANPEVDQLAGRFSAGRGWFGILVCRTVQDMDLLLARCADWARDRHSYIIPLTDHDLRRLVEARRGHNDAAMLQILRNRFDALIY
jgi:hypothetical protein